MKRIFFVLILIFLPAILFGGSQKTQDNGGPRVVTVWFHSGKGEEREVLNAQVENFINMQDEIVIDAVQLPEGTYNEQVQAAAAAGQLPDLLDFDGPNLYNYAWAGHLVPLDRFVSPEMKTDFLESILAQGEYNGHLYALGVFDSGLSIWGNRGYLERAGVRIPEGVGDPWTLEEFTEALTALQNLPEVEYAIDLKMNYGAGEWFTYGFSPILQSFGADLIDRDNYMSADGVLNGPAAVNAMTLLQNLFENGFSRVQPAGDDDFYGRKTAALSYVGHWMWGPHSEGLGEDLVLLPMPVFGERAVTGMGSWCWGITTQAEDKEAAWRFLEYLLQPEQIVRMTDANGAVPARKSALELSALYRQGGPLQLLAAQLSSGVAVPRPNTPAYPVITQAFSEAVNNIVRGADVQAELDKAVETIDQDIEDNAGYPVN
jgi:multiple sugar transport system substrate-binding protein